MWDRACREKRLLARQERQLRTVPPRTKRCGMESCGAMNFPGRSLKQMPTCFVRMTLNSKLSKYFSPVPLAQAKPSVPVAELVSSRGEFRMPAAQCFAAQAGAIRQSQARKIATL